MKNRIVLALLAAAVPIVLVVLSSRGSRAGRVQATHEAVDAMAGAPRGPEIGLLVRATEVAAAQREPRPEPRVQPRTDASARPAARATRAVAELARLLDSEPFDRPGFERVVRALAAPMTTEERGELVIGLASEEPVLARRLAACELLRVLAPGPDTLPAGLRTELHVLARSAGGGALPDSAARVLVALGDVTDVRILIDGLGEDGALRARCMRALASAAALGATTREAVVLELESALAGARGEGESALRRALRALQLDDLVGPETLAEILLAPASSDEERLASAEGLARASAELTPESRRAAQDVLVSHAEHGSPSERRRALYALGTLAEPDTLATLTHAVRFDPDPAARSAGVRALRGFEARATLESVAASDPSPEVRALAAQELADSGRSVGLQPGIRAREPGWSLAFPAEGEERTATARRR